MNRCGIHVEGLTFSLITKNDEYSDVKIYTFLILEKGLMYISSSLYIFVTEKEVRNYTKESKYGCTY
jgi:hypothetical protein